LIAFFGLAQGFLRDENIVENGSPFHKAGLIRPNDMREGRLEYPSEHLSQDFVDAPEERYQSPVIESSMISRLWYKGDYSFIYEGQGGTLIEHCRECLQEVRRDLLLAFMENSMGMPSWPGALSFGRARMALRTSSRERLLVMFAFTSPVTLIETLCQQCSCALAVPRAPTSDVYNRE